ncbi:hypothetical protein [Erythrobacter crassostreae]|uniref:Uncharacterized protein n=1 Tax=Erythrobacter crassostreae TaxID=2828328 RepID=A0A9X1JP57_9SPHN|nr:hypothetical protein [Erythrobacter crassostrea]MBV7259087.1 hypothetical protein [Erythrobacter crassostrea]
MSFASRFNPKTGVLDFWHEFRKPNPLRIPILIASTMPLVLMYFWVTSETAYKAPESPQITYITTYDPDRSDADIIASNEENQEVKDLRKAREEEIAQRKRDLYKALGAAAGMDVDEIEAEADARRAAEEAAEAERRAELFGRDGQDAASSEDATVEGTNP